MTCRKLLQTSAIQCTVNHNCFHFTVNNVCKQLQEFHHFIIISHDFPRPMLFSMTSWQMVLLNVMTFHDRGTPRRKDFLGGAFWRWAASLHPSASSLGSTADSPSGSTAETRPQWVHGRDSAVWRNSSYSRLHPMAPEIRFSLVFKLTPTNPPWNASDNNNAMLQKYRNITWNK